MNHISLEKEPWTEAKNKRRCELIDQKYAGRLTPAEALELARLHRRSMVGPVSFQIKSRFCLLL